VCFFAHNISELRTPVDSFVPNPEERLRVPQATQVGHVTLPVQLACRGPVSLLAFQPMCAAFTLSRCIVL
jgi:hypothetical protein